MKKILSIIFSASLIFGISTSVFAELNPADSSDVQKAKELINKTNDKIQEKIDKAVNESDKLRAEYLADVIKLGGIVAENELSFSIKASNQNETTMDNIQDLLLTIEEELLSEVKKESSEDHLLAVKDEISEITSLLVPDEMVYGFTDDGNIKRETVGNVYWEYEDLTNKYVKKLDRIITNLYNQTKKMSENTIEKVANVVIAECEWVPVRLGHLRVLIDPIHIVGEI